MGINKQTLEVLLNENQHKNITGTFLCTGRHTVNIDKFTIINLFNKYHLPTEKVEFYYEKQCFDNITRHCNSSLLDSDLLSSFCNAEYHCLDRSEYEGANIIHDMNTPVPDSLHGKYDFIYNGSCMDNMFNPASFIFNTSKMLKEGGRILHIECATGVSGAYLMFSPEWFFSYYAINNFKDCKVYVTVAREKGTNRHIYDTDLYSWQPYFTRQLDYDDIEACKSINGLMHVIVLAEKGKESTSSVAPIQMQYLDESTTDWRKQYKKFQQSKRPLIRLLQKKENSELPFLTDHYSYLGSGF